MSLNEYRFRAHDFEECRLIHSTLPQHVDDSNLSVAAWQFLEFYETDKAIAVLSDYRDVDGLSDIALSVIRALIEKSFTYDRFVAAVWITGANEAIAGQLRGLLTALRLDTGLVVETHAEGLGVLRGYGAEIPESFELAD